MTEPAQPAQGPRRGCVRGRRAPVAAAAPSPRSPRRRRPPGVRPTRRGLRSPHSSVNSAMSRCVTSRDRLAVCPTCGPPARPTVTSMPCSFPEVPNPPTTVGPPASPAIRMRCPNPCRGCPENRCPGDGGRSSAGGSSGSVRTEPRRGRARERAKSREPPTPRDEVLGDWIRAARVATKSTTRPIESGRVRCAAGTAPTGARPSCSHTHVMCARQRRDRSPLAPRLHDRRPSTLSPAQPRTAVDLRGPALEQHIAEGGQTRGSRSSFAGSYRSGVRVDMPPLVVT